MATNRLPASSRKRYDHSTFYRKIGVRSQAACGSTLTLCQKMDAVTQHAIETAFQITDGPQVVLTSISAREPSPCEAGDHLVLHALNGRIERARIERIEYALKPGGNEFYGLALGGDAIPEFGDFTGGSFEVEPR